MHSAHLVTPVSTRSTNIDMAEQDKVNILLVDDQPAKLLSYELILSEVGENLIKASSAREALEQLLRKDIAVVVTDVAMPELDGFELAAMIREHPRSERTAIIFVSAIHLTDLDRLRGYEVGAVDYLPVPVVPELLRAKVRVFAELYRKTRQLERFNTELERRVTLRTAELAKANAELDRAQQTAGIGSWESAPEIGQQTWSKELYRICGLPEEPGQASVHDIAALIHEDDQKRYGTWLARIEAGQDPGVMELRIRRPDGECRVLLADGEAMVADGAVRRVSCTLQDVTERKAASAQFDELRAELIHVSRLTELGQMVSALAHEVNQPLTAMANYLSGAQRLLAAGNQAGGAAAMARVAEQLERARQIIRRLRDLVRKRQTERGVVNLAKTIEEASAIALVGASASLRLEIRVAEDAAEAVIDKIQIQQVLLNLIRNAMEAMAESERRELIISTSLERERVAVHVADSGPGLPDNVRARLFQPFVTTKPDGMGVGLSVCRHIIEAHGGVLRAANRDGGGTVFSFTLPPAGSPADE